jgi:hypothetical protein
LRNYDEKYVLSAANSSISDPEATARVLKASVETVLVDGQLRVLSRALSNLNIDRISAFQGHYGET